MEEKSQVKELLGDIMFVVVGMGVLLAALVDIPIFPYWQPAFKWLCLLVSLVMMVIVLVRFHKKRAMGLPLSPWTFLLYWVGQALCIFGMMIHLWD